MSQPFVMSLKLVGEDDGASAVVNQVTRDIGALKAQASALATGGVQRSIDQMLGIGSSSGRGIDQAKTDIAAYGNALDEMRAKYNPLFALERQHKQGLAEIARAYHLGAISADENTAAVERQKTAHLASVAALDLESGAHGRNAAAMSRSAFQRTNLLFQLQDIMVSLAGGMNPALVFAQQGSQISMIWGPEEGGVGRALQETGKMAGGAALKFWPIALAAAAVGVAVGGLRHEIEETSGVSISFGDVFLAVFQVIGDRLYNWLKPAIDQIAPWFTAAWELAVQATKAAVNFMVSTVLVFVEQVRLVHEVVPEMFKLAGQLAANFFLDGIEQMVNRTLAEIDLITQGINAVLKTDIALTPKLDLGPLEFDSAATTDKIGKIFQGYQATVGGILDTDYAGDFFSDVQTQAVKNYNAGLDDTAKKAKAAGSGLDKLKGQVDQTAEAFKSAFSGIGSGLFDAIKQGGDIGGSILDMLIGKAEQFVSTLLDNAINPAVGAGGDWIGNLLGSLFGGAAPGFSYAAGVQGDPWAGMRDIGQNAAGTANWRGGLTEVNEEGSEVIDLPSGTRIWPADISRSMAANSSKGAGSDAKMEVHIHPTAGQTATTKETSDGRGGRRTDIVLNEAVGNAISTPRGPAQAALAGVGRIIKR